MYRKGDLQITVPPCVEMLADPDGECYSDEHQHEIRDARGPSPAPLPAAFLPHSCDAWVIGGPNEIRELIADLEIALEGGRMNEEYVMHISESKTPDVGAYSVDSYLDHRMEPKE